MPRSTLVSSQREACSGGSDDWVLMRCARCVCCEPEHGQCDLFMKRVEVLTCRVKAAVSRRVLGARCWPSQGVGGRRLEARWRQSRSRGRTGREGLQVVDVYGWPPNRDSWSSQFLAGHETTTSLAFCY